MSIESSPLRDRMIFVVGARRSGTNWIGRIIEAHPDVAAVRSESHLFSHGISPLMACFQHASKGSWQVGSIYMERDDLTAAVRTFCDTVFASVLADDDTGATRLLERTPHHSRYLQAIGAVYPDARVVHIVRDGRDVIRSLQQMSWGPSTVAEAAEEWVESVTAARRDGPALAAFREVRYEDLLADPRGRGAELYEWLGLPVSDEILDRAELESSVSYNVDRTSPEIAVEKWRQAFDDAELAEIERVAGPVLAELGYASAPVSSRPARPRPSVPSRVKGLARQLRRRQAPPAAADHDDHHWIQYVVDRFVAAIREDRADDALALLDPTVRVQVIDPDHGWDDRGPDAAARLVEELRADPVFRGRQARCDVWPSPTAFTLVLEGGGGRRVLVLYATTEAIKRVGYYRL